jgi:hypothetical protein
MTAIFTGDWINVPGTNDFDTWGGAVDFCIAQGANDLCSYDVYCPDGAGSPPFGGLRVGKINNADLKDQWSPISGEGQNVWVQTGEHKFQQTIVLPDVCRRRSCIECDPAQVSGAATPATRASATTRSRVACMEIPVSSLLVLPTCITR